jgi:uncharacterized protein (TIGR04255 family)
MHFPIPIPERLPARIAPCPIVEAALEIRFVTEEPWTTLPGLLFTKIRERYSKQRDLDLAKLPEEFRRQDPALTYLPLMQFQSGAFTLQFGPRVLSLVTKTNDYPGWQAIEEELGWVLGHAVDAGFIREAERLGARYIDFFAEDIFQHLILRPVIGDAPFESKELSISTVLRQEALTARLKVTNSAIVKAGNVANRGSILDIDSWVGPLDFSIGNAIERFNELHLMAKRTFFGLLKPEFLATLNPSYA